MPDEGRLDDGRAARHERQRQLRRRRAWRRLVLLVGGVATLVGATLVVQACSGLPGPNITTLRYGRSSVVFDAAGQAVATVPGPNESLPVNLDQIPPTLRDAFVAVEDKRFYHEGAIDPRGLIRAAVADLTGHALQGGSTITEQLAKILYLTPSPTLTYKVQEIWLGVELAARYSRNQVLDAYLNNVYLGEHAYGVGAAAHVYFALPVGQLSLPQEALLAGLPQEPVGYDPYLHPGLARTRRNTVLALMAQQGYITQAQAHQAEAASLGLAAKPQAVAQRYSYPWFVDAVVTQLERQYHIPAAQVQQGGLRIYTTLQPKVQDAAQKAVDAFAARAPHGLQTGEAVVVPGTGDVAALVGGVQHTTFLAYDRATQAQRQPGSSIKPLVDYLPALEHGMTAGTVVDDTPHAFGVGAGQPPYVPVDDNGRYYGLTTLTEALRRSVNTIAVQVLNRIGVQTGLASGRRLGLPLTAADAHLALALGGTTDCCSPLAMANAYATLASGGIYAQPRLITRVVAPSGRVLVDNPVRARRVVDPRVAYVLTRMLETVDQPQPNQGWDVLQGPLDSNWGTGYDATVHDNVPGWPTAAKTGTTNSSRDAWYVGYTQPYAAAVWVGYDQPRPMPGTYGGTMAGPIFRQTLTLALAGRKPVDFPRPRGVVQAPIDIKAAPWTVAAPGPLTPQADIRQEWFVAGTQPTQPSPLWVTRTVDAYDPTGRWAPFCGDPATRRVFLNRPPFTNAQARHLASIIGVPWRTLLPVDRSLMPPTSYC